MFMALGTIIFSAAALNFDIDLFNKAVSNNAAVVLPIMANNPAIGWWPSILDFFGFYLLLLPLALYLHRVFKGKVGDWMNLFTVCGLGYILFGAMGAAVLAAVFSTQAEAYSVTTGAAQQMHIALFQAFGAAIQRGVWGILDPILAGIWWTGLGLLFRRARPFLAWYTILLGLINLSGGIGAALGLEVLAGFCLNLYFFMAPVWAFWLGFILIRQGENALNSTLVPTD